MLNWLRREPLVHFLVIGVMLYGISLGLSEGQEGAVADDKTIDVTKAALFSFLQHRGNISREDASRYWARLAPAAQTALIESYIEEEVLFRTALAFGLDQNDYVIKRRLIQRMEFAALGLAGRDLEPKPAEVRAYFEANQSDYIVPEKITFSHIYLNPARYADLEELQSTAESWLFELNARQPGLADNGEYGDRFPYYRRYVDRDRVFITDHFDDGFAEAVFTQHVNANWQGPIQSQHGLHLVLIQDRRTAELLPFSEVRDQVATEVRRQQKLAASAAYVTGLKSQFDIRVAPVLQP